MSSALLIAIGIGPDRNRSVPGCREEFSEGEARWREFLESLVTRCMNGVKLVVSDDHTRPKAARQVGPADVPSQDCRSQLLQSAMADVPKVPLRVEVAGDLRPIVDATEPAELEQRLRDALARCQMPDPQLTAWLDENVPKPLTVLRPNDASLLR